MKQLVMVAAMTAALCTSAFAGGSRNAINVGASVSTGKGGLVGALLGSPGHGSTGLKVNVVANTGKNGLLGTLLGGNSSHHGGY